MEEIIFSGYLLLLFENRGRWWWWKWM